MRHGKGNKPRTVRFGKRAAKAIWEYLKDWIDSADPKEPLVRVDEDQEPHAMSRHILHRLVKWIGDRAGVKNVHPHRLRHSFATEYLRNGGKMLALQDLLGHGDWWSDNIRWEGRRLLSVDDWDSIVSLPEPALAGVAAALFAFGQSTIEESATFLEAYIAASGKHWNALEYQHAWAAGLWARLFDARKESMRGVFEFASLLEGEVEERLKRAGVKARLSEL